MKYRIILNDEDYLRFRIFHTHHSKSGKNLINQFRTKILKDFAVVSFIILYFFMSDAKYNVAMMYIILLAIVYGYIYISMPKKTDRSIEKHVIQIKEDGKLPYHADAEIEFTESMIIHRSEQGENYINYRDIENVYYDQDYMYIYINAVHAFIIPYHCLGEDRERVIEYVKIKKS